MRLNNPGTIVLMLLLAATIGGCSNVGTVNGIRMNASTAPEATYCDKNPAVCLLIGVAIVGGGIALVESRHSNAPPAVPLGPPPGPPPL